MEEKPLAVRPAFSYCFLSHIYEHGGEILLEDTLLLVAIGWDMRFWLDEWADSTEALALKRFS